MDVVVDSIPGTWSESRPKKYTPILVRLYPDPQNFIIYFLGQGVRHGKVGGQLPGNRFKSVEMFSYDMPWYVNFLEKTGTDEQD